jgi:HEAT repeat protein
MVAPIMAGAEKGRDSASVIARGLEHPDTAMRARAARQLGEHPMGHVELFRLVFALEDQERAVADAAWEALDRLVAARPDVVRKLVKDAKDEETAPGFALGRYLVHVGTPEALEGALATMADEAVGDEWMDLVDRLAAAKHPTNEQLETLLADEDAHPDVQRAAAAILGARGVERGYEVLFELSDDRLLVEAFIARGPAGVRIVCRAMQDSIDWFDNVADRLKARRKQTETAIRQLAEDATSGGDRMAAYVLGYWDAPEHVQLLLRVAEDATRSSEVRDEAIEALGRLEAPEALDVLIRKLLDTKAEDTTRLKCADALGAIGNHGALEALASVAETTSDKTLRRSAMDAIDSIKNGT